MGKGLLGPCPHNLYCFTAEGSAAVPAAVRRASRPPRRGRDVPSAGSGQALGTAGKMPALLVFRGVNFMRPRH